MSDKYIITKEEINQILLHSPYALSLAPSKNGMSGEQTKKYFYDFIPVLVEKLNFKMKDVELSEIANEKMVDEIWEAINTLGADIVSAMSKATQAYNLASGKSKVYVWGNVRHLFGDILNSLNNEANNLRVGDFILITEKGFPDFIVSSSPDDVKIPPNGYVSVTAENYLDVEIKEGTAYAFLNGFSLIGIESGIDTSVFATKEELTSQINEAKGSAESAMEMAQSAYNVASGKRAVHYEQTMQFAFLHLCYDSESLNDGDMIVIGAKGVPDLIVFKSAEPLQGATIVAHSQIEENTLPEIVPGGKYRLDVGENGKYIGFVAIESSTNIDTSVFTTKDELASQMSDATNQINEAKDSAESAMEKANRAYELVLGRKRVYVVSNFLSVIAEMFFEEGMSPGDHILVTDKNVPDFVVVNFDSSLSSASITDVSWNDKNSIPEAAQVGQVYRLVENDRAIMAIESGIDTSAFATKEELSDIASQKKK